MKNFQVVKRNNDSNYLNVTICNKETLIESRPFAQGNNIKDRLFVTLNPNVISDMITRFDESF